MRGKNILRMTIIALLIMSTTLVNVAFAIPQMIKVNPPTTMANPGDSFAVDITIAFGSGVNAWEFKLVHGPCLRLFKAIEGDFLSTVSEETFFTFRREAGYTIVTCLITEEVTASGSGILATMHYVAEAPGDVVLDLKDTILLDINGDPMLDLTETDGYWYSTTPAALFDISPGPHEEHAHWHAGVLLTFDASASYDPDGGSIVSYDWDYGDETTDTGNPVTNTYTTGHYTVTLNVTDNEGEWWITTADVPVSGAPVAEFDYFPYNPRVGDSVAFDADGTEDVCGTIATLNWTFGDGEFEELHYPHIELATNHEYSTPGTYTVTLTVTDFDDNEVSAVPKDVTVYAWYEADLIMKRVDPSRRPKMPGPVTLVGKGRCLDWSEVPVYVKCVFIITTETGEEITLETPSAYVPIGEESPELSVDWTPEEPGKYFGTAYCWYGVDDVIFDIKAAKLNSFSFEVKP